MAQRRMFSKKITDTDLFLDMPLSAQCLYFHLNMEADDDGFIGNAKTIRRKVGASEDDMKVLITKHFILPFDTGVVVVKDWRIHNYIQKDRYHETVYTDEKALLEVRENGEYTTCIQDGYKMDTEVRLELELELGKSKSKSKSNIVKGDDDEMTTPTPYQNCIGYWQQQVNANVNTITIDTLKEWVVKFGEQGDDIVKYGIDVMLYNGASRLGYLEAILKEWYGVHVDTVDKAKAYSEQRKQQQQQRNGNQQSVYHVEDYRKELYGE